MEVTALKGSSCKRVGRVRISDIAYAIIFDLDEVGVRFRHVGLAPESGFRLAFTNEILSMI
jgi:hypothetical protein